ncbi:prolyl oligopeptidase family serine peptidase [Kribbella sp. CA-293567]|uniref:prolyl oligopeptidase family serine peptidase n=1 Tax=Kribbella sp. CA-293567 TaxID=3002436 RepID=UPI0022DD963D|nr:prolyl oligopeptidase family serine peptidase [Kribbella sp. CA-293567]WBQ06057.1 prolyl oligopeptidase family serine peptidase [Kribbella sp. CA-293567]
MRHLDLSYPGAERLPLVDHLHGHAIPDPYRWLEDATSAQTQQWQADQDQLWLNHATTLPDRYKLRSRVRALSGVGSVTAPVWRGDRCFVVRRSAEQEHPVLYVDDAVLLDPQQLDPTGRTTLDSWQPSPDGALLAFQLSRGGDEQSVLHVLDLATGQLVEDPIDGCRYSPVAWLPDGKSFYYVRFRQVLHHHVGRSDDTTVFATEASYGLDLSADGRWLTISAARGPANDLWLMDLTRDTPPTVVQQGVDAITVMSVSREGRLFIVTTRDAPTGRICVGDPEEPLVWHDFVPADPSAPLSSLAILDKVVLVGRTRNAVGEIAIHDLVTGRPLGEVPLPGVGSVGSLATRPEGGHQVWFSYTDSVTPSAVYVYDTHSAGTTLWSPPPGAVGVPEADSHQVDYTSADGTELRMLVVGKPGDHGPRPTILYGYGGFGQSLTPTYSAFALAWVEAGGVFVTANLRGGGERGNDWHKAGMLDQKQNVFDDYLAAAETLIAEGWTTPDQLAVCGESNGGLLVGAAITQRPELFAAAVCSAPLLDMVRYEQFGLGQAWVPEFGSAADPAQLENLLSYSPYHRVRPGVKYPATLFTVFAADTRVDPLHARKMCAALQHATDGSRLVLLRLEQDAGHASGSASKGIGLAADMLAFLAHHTGLHQ